MKDLLLVVIMLTAASSVSDAQARQNLGAPSPDIPAFVQRLDSLRKAADIPGVSVAVVKDQEIVLALGLGYADLERRIAAAAETPYNIASVTKPLSAVVALRLVEKNMLDLDRPIADYSEWAEFCSEFSRQPSIFAAELRCQPTIHTLRHLLSHTATATPGSRFSYNPPAVFLGIPPDPRCCWRSLLGSRRTVRFCPGRHGAIGPGASGLAPAGGFGGTAGPAPSGRGIRGNRTCSKAVPPGRRRCRRRHHDGPRPRQVRCRSGSREADIGGVPGSDDGSDEIEQR